MTEYLARGDTSYWVPASAGPTLKKACKHMGLSWTAEAARPDTAKKLVELVDEHGLEKGCEMWAEFLRWNDST